MKLPISLIAAVTALSAVAIAQTPTPTEPTPAPAPVAAPAAPVAPAAPAIPPSTCGALPAEPTLPEPGSVRTPQEMRDITENQVNTWIAAARAVLKCRQDEANALNAELRLKQQTRDARVQEFNGAQTRVTDVGTRWQAEIDAFNARKGGVNRNEGKTGRNAR